ncbi:MAG TPA: hypothetical protein VNI54_06350 [Thermoanaerobaculia bacterium]|nr:hypothetical protein [Thermoanaerobaculia bacterium]
MHAAAVLLLATLDLTGHVGARGGSDDATAHAHLGLDYAPAQWLALHVSGTEDGLIEAHATLRRELGLDDVQLRAGTFFLPTSRENRDDNWASPYTIGFSSLNAWIGEEVRPIGVDLQYRHITARGQTLAGGVTAFRGNDTMGTLLAWRGWSHGDRLSALGETLSLPSLPSLADDGPFQKQRDAGTQPFGSDLDGNTGWSGRVRYGPVQYTYVDNNGDRALHGDQYSWQTRFHLLGAELGDPDRFIVASEYMRGDTYMGLGQPFVAADFHSAYVLASLKRGRQRFSARYELFSTSDRDHSAAEVNDESGRAWTLTYFFYVTPRLRAGAEFLQVAGHRSETDLTEHTWTFEARWRFE